MTPTVVIAGVRSGVGKTTIATGIMGALTRRGYSVQPFKAGPDYIDPSYHRVACGVASRNLDTWLLPHPTVLELYEKASARRQISVIEGVMGLFDGHSSLDEEGSTAQLAKLLGAPVLLVADASKVARSVAAEVLGFQQFDPGLNVAGVILNGVGSDAHLQFCKPQVEATTGLPVLGYLPRRPDFEQPERHLGLIPTVEGTVARQWFDALIAQVEETIDVSKIAALAGAARPPSAQQQVYPAEQQRKRAVIAVAQDQAFNFYYQDSLDLLEAWGAEIAPFSPLEDDTLPEGAGGVYLGGGFPEMFAAELSANRPHAGLHPAGGRPWRPGLRGVRRPDVSRQQPDRFRRRGSPHDRAGARRIGYVPVPPLPRLPRGPSSLRHPAPGFWRNRAAVTNSTGRRWSVRPMPTSRSTASSTRMAGPTAFAPVASGPPTFTSTSAARRDWPPVSWKLAPTAVQSERTTVPSPLRVRVKSSVPNHQ